MLNNREIKMLDIFSSGEEVSIKKLKEKSILFYQYLTLNLYIETNQGHLS